MTNNILTENKLNGDNFREWKWNLLIVLNCEKHKFVFGESYLLGAQPKMRNHRRDSDSIARCYMLASMNHENFGGFARRPSRIGSTIFYYKFDELLTDIPNTQVKEYKLKFLGFFVEAEDNEVEIDVNTQIEILFKSLTKKFCWL
ncbi:hypothetical protein PVK06_008943 [Gossypium arboreum]|uniref:Uncharacterized protein n=1 Tax=Gossypium arboreum TaxID=29729 RepID=A0ABR0QL88_GOSAR|nr:hypothetical protein PVK06_008943 [Gossypium arboreum]